VDERIIRNEYKRNRLLIVDWLKIQTSVGRAPVNAKEHYVFVRGDKFLDQLRHEEQCSTQSERVP
jgi:hypothetical protein